MPAPVGSAARATYAANRLPSDASSAISCASRAPPAIGVIGGRESWSKHMALVSWGAARVVGTAGRGAMLRRRADQPARSSKTHSRPSSSSHCSPMRTKPNCATGPRDATLSGETLASTRTTLGSARARSIIEARAARA